MPPLIAPSHTHAHASPASLLTSFARPRAMWQRLAACTWHALPQRLWPSPPPSPALSACWQVGWGHARVCVMLRTICSCRSPACKPLAPHTRCLLTHAPPACLRNQPPARPPRRQGGDHRAAARVWNHATDDQGGRQRRRPVGAYRWARTRVIWMRVVPLSVVESQGMLEQVLLFCRPASQPACNHPPRPLHTLPPPPPRPHAPPAAPAGGNH